MCYLFKFGFVLYSWTFFVAVVNEQESGRFKEYNYLLWQPRSSPLHVWRKIIPINVELACCSCNIVAMRGRPELDYGHSSKPGWVKPNRTVFLLLENGEMQSWWSEIIAKEKISKYCCAESVFFVPIPTSSRDLWVLLHKINRKPVAGISARLIHRHQSTHWSSVWGAENPCVFVGHSRYPRIIKTTLAGRRWYFLQSSMSWTGHRTGAA